MEPQNEILSQKTSESTPEQDRVLRFRNCVFGFTCIGIFLSIILILVFINNAAGSKDDKNKNPTDLSKGELSQWGVGNLFGSSGVKPV